MGVATHLLAGRLLPGTPARSGYGEWPGSGAQQRGIWIPPNCWLSEIQPLVFKCKFLVLMTLTTGVGCC